MPTLTKRHTASGAFNVYMPHVNHPVGVIVPIMREDTLAKIRYRGRITLAGKHVDGNTIDTRRISGIHRNTSTEVLDELERLATIFYGDGAA